MASHLRVGQRVRIPNGFEGYVRFIGKTSFKEGEWIGLELDEPEGKNNGSVGGTQYFECEDGHGMFMRPLPNIEVLEEPKPVAKTPQPVKSAIGSRQTGLNGTAVRTSTTGPRLSTATGLRAGGVPKTSTTGLSRPSSTTSSSSRLGTAGRPSLAPPAKRTSVAPSPASSTTSTSPRRLSNAVSNPPTNTRVSRLSTASSRSVSPQKPSSLKPSTTTTSARVSTVGARPTVRSDVSPDNTSSPSSNRDGVLSPSNTRTGSNADGKRPTASTMPPPAKPSAVSDFKQNKLINELQTKVQFLEKKRLEDREKLDKVRRLPELEEKTARYETVIQKLQTKCQTLVADNQAFKKNDSELRDTLEKLERAQAEHESILELANLDREMAEETSAGLKMENSALKSRVEELSLENEVLHAENAEFSEDMTAEEKASQGWVHLQRENVRLKDALFRLRDFMQDQEEDLKADIKQLEEDTVEFGALKEEHEENKAKLEEMTSENEHIKEQLEAALASETMIEHLTDQNLAQAAQIDQMQKANDDLQELKDLSDELELSHVEHEKQLQEVIDFNESLLAETARKLAREREEVADREYTIVKFRELVSTLQGDLEELRQSKEVSEREAASLENSSRRILDMNRQLQASAHQGTVKAVDMELQRLNAEQATDELKVSRDLAPDAFATGEQGSVMAWLRFKRIGVKAGLLRGFVRQRVADTSAGSNVYVKCEALDKLVWMSAMTERFVSCIEGCSVEQFAKFEQTHLEMESVERHLTNYIESLKRNDLQESLVVEGLNKSMAVMRHVAEVYLTSGLDAFAEEVIMRAQLVQGALENATTVLTAAKDEVHRAAIHPVPEGEPEQQMSDEFHFFERNSDSTLANIRSAKVIAGKFLQILRDMKTRSLALNPEHITKLDRLRDAVNSIYEQFRATGIAVHGFIALQHERTDVDEITFDELDSVIQHSSLDSQTNDIFYRTQNNLRATSTILNEMVDAAGDFTQLVEFEKAPAPWIVKNKELAGRKVLSAAAEDEIRNLKRDLQERATQLRVRQQEMEEVGMKVELLEKRNKEAQIKIERMSELEKMVEEGANREQDWEKRLEEKEGQVQKVEEERDNWMKKVAEGTVVVNNTGVKGHERSGSGAGDLLVGSKLEMERLRAEIKMLEEANRYLRNQIRKTKHEELVDPEANSWLNAPLKKQRISLKTDDSAVADAKSVLRNIAMLPLGVKPLRLGIGKDNKDKTKTLQTSTPKYQILVEEMRKIKAWEPVRIAGVDMPVMVD